MENTHWTGTEKVLAGAGTAVVGLAAVGAMLATRGKLNVAELSKIIPAAQGVLCDVELLGSRIEKAIAAGPQIKVPSRQFAPQSTYATMAESAEKLFPIVRDASQQEILGFVKRAVRAGEGHLETVDGQTQLGAWNGRAFVFRQDLNQTAIRQHPFAFTVIDHSTDTTTHYANFHRWSGRLTFKGPGNDGISNQETWAKTLRRAGTDAFYSAENKPLGTRIGELLDAHPVRSTKPVAPPVAQIDLAEVHHRMAVEQVRTGGFNRTDNGSPYFRIAGPGGFVDI